MSINELTELVAAPETPKEVPAEPDWKKVEAELGTALPGDYKEFVLTFGTGLLGSFVRVYNPFAASVRTSLISASRLDCEILQELKESEGDEEVPFEIFPEVPGLLPWGNDENGNGLYWLTDGEADSWSVIVGAGRDRRWQQFDMTMTSFLAKSFRGDVICNIWPDGFANPDRRYVFEAF